MILKVLRPLWTDHRDTAKKVRGQMEKIIAAGYAGHGLKPGDNPCVWKNDLESSLAAKGQTKKSYKSMPYSDAPAFMADLNTREALSAKPLQFLTLTAVRAANVRFMEWGDVDLEKAVWTIPGDKVKNRKEFRVPLSAAALKILNSMPRINDLVFPGMKGKAMSDAT
jgi:integrase